MADKYNYDVLYIGAGHGTFDGAIPLAQKGFKVGVIEADKVGGTCPNWGCNAKIALDTPIKIYEQQKQMSNILEGNLKINWRNNVENKRKTINSLPSAIESGMKSMGIDVIKGWGKLVDKNTVSVDDRKITSKNIVIATGLRPNKLDIPGTDLSHDSKEFMDLDEMPNNIAIIGSGYIAMEFATIANAVGANVTVFMHSDRILRQFYQPYTEILMKSLENKGIKFIKSANVASFSKENDKFVVEYGDNEKFETDWILDAAGRIPNVENIGLEDVGVDFDKKGIKVDNYLRTSVDNIYASGDVADAGQPKLTPTAVFQSTYLMKLFAKLTDKPIDYPSIPSVAFTMPRIGQVGVSVDEAKSNPDKYDIKENNLTDSDWYRIMTNDKIAQNNYIYNKEHQLVGFTEISNEADNAVDSLLPIIDLKLNKDQMGQIVQLFPSITSDTWGNM
ncbi:dihydrolipoyl dehydrogenase family protein [Apilactobacillus ozensis]|uniref:dihydrolipoyl dehydrogenase family protein n=1 Tax=Apilactobacillus ozensis TaxID=866801 RepID=UPI00200B8C9E|nr:NAD(P)/FAD-dependent oxidoreductase [Apilactobacillus ozensis]MCK8607459.1 NAD(P)/FAD-dependent oxidoreductase [Apilactobacillus ozensis]